MWNLNTTQMSISMKQKHIHTYRENRLMAAKGKVGRKTDWEIGISRYTLLVYKIGKQ